MSADLGIPVTVLTGFLGSGKTTLLNRLLARPELADTAVLINEFGEIGLDHLLVRRIDEGIVVLNSGCLCCTVRGDLIHAMRDLFLKRVKGVVPEFSRLVIETTGLADPAPVLHTLMTDAFLAARYRLDGIVVTIDTMLGLGQLADHSEAAKQAAMADRLVLTKTDLAPPEARIMLVDALRRLNPSAPLHAAVLGEIDPGLLLEAGLFRPGEKIPDVAGWLREAAFETHHHAHGDHGHDVNRHDQRIGACCVTIARPLPWMSFLAWIETLIAHRGADLLRVKGILAIEGQDKPVVIHGIQHVFHPPTTLPAWPDDDRRSRLVFITRDMPAEFLESSLQAFLGES